MDVQEMAKAIIACPDPRKAWQLTKEMTAAVWAERRKSAVDERRAFLDLCLRASQARRRAQKTPATPQI